MTNNIIYISHPFQNKSENKADIENIVRDLVQEFPDYTFVSPVHTFGYLYTDVSYERGLDMCIDLLNMCDEMWVCGDYLSSVGCKTEINYCQQNNIPYKILGKVEGDE